MAGDHIDFLVEEPSTEAFLRSLLDRCFADLSYQVYPFQGKRDLLEKLPARLEGYRRWLPPGVRIVVLVDRDNDDCRELKERVAATARRAGLQLKAAEAEAYQLVTRIAVEELEAWFFGDVEALAEAYPRVPATLGEKRAFRDPDAITGGTWEALERVLQRAGYFRGGLAKIELARTMASHMDLDRNRSRSFQLMVRTLRELAGA